MSGYRKIEKNIATFLAGHPVIKNRLKLAYQRLNHFVYKKKYDVKLAYGVRSQELFPNKNYGQFWGYYDSSPALDHQYLSHRFKMEPSDLNPEDRETMEIWLNDKKVSETIAWNWQQGSRLFWVDPDTILHNTYFSGEYSTKLIHLRTGSEQYISSPVYAYHKNTKTALGLNFKRLAFLDPAYGYFKDPLPETFDFNDQHDGIFHIDLTENRSSLIISIDRLKSFIPHPTMLEAIHGINHLQIAPSGTRFMFLHQWYLKNGRKYGRLITSNLDGSDMYVLSDDGMVSHCNWKNDQEIIGWMYKENFGNAYFQLRDRSDEFEQIGKGVLSEDGHPSVSPCGKYLLTDTYPDRFRMSRVLLYEFATQKLQEIGSFYSPLKFHDEKRCDLHPRYTDAENITIDTVHKGVRQQVELNISSLL